LNPVRSVRIVNGRFSSGCVVGDFGFCDLNSPDLFLTAIGADLGTVRDGLALVIQLDLDAIRSAMGTNLLQRCVELTRALPRNVCPRTSSQVTPNLDTEKGCCVRDGWKIAAADDRNDHDYR